MYGGHIVEDWDRRLANAYLMRYFNEELLESIELFPGFSTPPGNMNHKQVVEYIEGMPVETPLAFGLHPNAQIGFKMREAESFCASVLNLQPREVRCLPGGRPWIPPPRPRPLLLPPPARPRATAACRWRSGPRWSWTT